MKALIFGITGQDGSYLAELLLSKGYEVCGVARRVSVDTTQRISGILKNVQIVEGDITDEFCVSGIISDIKPMEIYNLAAQSHVGTSFKQPSLTWEITAGGCLNILESIRTLNLHDKVKFYQASSSEMFGRNYSVDSNNLKYQDESTPFQPQSPYAIAKLAAHYLVDNYRTSYGIFGCSGILFNHESERRGDQFVTRKITKWIGKFANWIGDLTKLQNATFDNENIIVGGNIFPKLRLGNLDARRDWGHAEDYVNAMWLMMQKEKPEDYVVSSGSTYSVAEFLTESFNYVGIQDWTDFVYQDPFFTRPAEVDYLLGKCDKAKEKLGWKIKISFKDLVKRMVENDLNEARL